MMKIADSFLQIFDKTKHHISSSSPEILWTIKEVSCDASIKKLHVKIGGLDFYAFDERLTKGMGHITNTRSTILEDKECDGIAFVEDLDKCRLIFCDLKSKFDSKKINHGFNQDLMSFLKMHMLLSICDGYELKDFDIDFIVACKCFEDDNKQDSFLHMLQSKQIADSDSFNTNILTSLLTKGEKCVKIGDFPNMSNINIHPSIKDKKIKLRLLMSNNYNDDFVNYSI